MKNKKIYVISTILLACLVTFNFALVQAYSSVTSQYYYGAISGGSSHKAVHQGAAASSATHQNFQAQITGYVNNIRLWCYVKGTPIDNVVSVSIISCGNSATGAPDEGTIYAESTSSYTEDDFEVLDTGYGATAQASYIDWAFNGTYQLTAGTYYCLLVKLLSATFVDTNNCTGVYWDLSSSTFNGDCGIYVGGWGDQANTDVIHVVYVTNNEGEAWVADSDPATPGPLPTGGLNVDTTDADVVMSALIDYGVPVVVMLLPVLFLWLIGGRGKWPFLMGIAIGTGMGYLFGLVPVWLVFIVSIVEVGMAYQSVRSGN